MASPFLKSAKKVTLQKDFDEYYIDLEPVKRIKVVGKHTDAETGEVIDDYVEVTKIIEHKRSIHEVVNADANDVGVEAYMKKMALSGQDIMANFDGVSSEVQDFTQCPETTGEMLKQQEAARNAYDNLPAELKAGLTYEQFMSGDYVTMFNNFVAMLNAQQAAAEKAEGDKE